MPAMPHICGSTAVCTKAARDRGVHDVAAGTKDVGAGLRGLGLGGGDHRVGHGAPGAFLLAGCPRLNRDPDALPRPAQAQGGRVCRGVK